MDPAAQLRQLLSSPDAMRQLIEETQQTVNQAAPQIAVPVRDVPPPVKIQGTVRFQATFPWESIAGLTTEEVKERIVETFSGERSPWLPAIHLGAMDIWQERHLVGPGTDPGHGTGAGIIPPGVSGPRGEYQQDDVGHSPLGTEGWQREEGPE